MQRLRLLLFLGVSWLTILSAVIGLTIDSTARSLSPESESLPVRGMYVSPYDVTETGLFGAIISDPCKVNALVQFIQAHSIKSLSLYDLHRILPHPVLAEQLADFIQHVRRYGVVEVNAIGAVLQDFTRIGEYLAAHAHSEQFDGLLTEVEFWLNPDADVKYADFAALLQEIKALNLTARGKSMPLGAYLGYLDDSTGASAIEKATTISALADSIYLHCYGQQGYQTFSVCQERLQLFADTQASVKIIPIFSAEGGEYHAAYPFQGDYFRATGIDSGEALFREAFAADTLVANSNLQLASFQYYEYRYLGRYLPTTESHTSLGCSVRKAANVL